MINVMEDSLADVPVLHVVKAELHEKALPTVLYYHGYNGEKISSLTLAYQIAEKGYRVILPDCMYHGDRKKEMDRTDKALSFWDIVMNTIEEMPLLKDELIEKGYSNGERIGIGGTSMGGIITYGSLVRYPWLQIAAVLMGTAYMTDYAKWLIDEFNAASDQQVTHEEAMEVIGKLAGDDMSLHPSTLQNRPLLIWHGEEDEVVPYRYSVSFYEAMLDYYEDKERIHFVSEPDRAHHVSKLAMNETANWFNTYL